MYMNDVKLKPIRPFFTLSPFWDDDEWMNISSGSHGLEVYETENEIVVKAPIPGIPAENLEVTFEEGVLRIRGKVEEREEDKKRKKVVHQSQRVQSFDYATTLPRPIDVSNVNAEIEHGIVTITAPLAIEAKPRKIEVKTR